MITRFAVSPAMTRLIVAGAGVRAVKAAEMAVSGRVKHFAGSQFFVAGETDTYIVDIADGSCSCPDGHAPHDANGRKLCKHMIAAMLSGEEV